MKTPAILLKHVRKLQEGFDEFERLERDEFHHEADQLREQLSFLACEIIDDLEQLSLLPPKRDFGGHPMSVVAGALGPPTDTTWLELDHSEWWNTSKQLLAVAERRLAEMAGDGQQSGNRASNPAASGVTLLGRLKTKAENHVGWVAVVVAVGTAGAVATLYQTLVIPNIERGYQADLKETQAGAAALKRRCEATQSADSSSSPSGPTIPGLLVADDCPSPSELTGTPGTRQWCRYQDDAGNFVKHGPYREWHPGCTPDTVVAGGAVSGFAQPFGGLVSSTPQLRPCVLHVDRYFNHGQLDGDDRLYHSNGQPSLVGLWKDGKRVGVMEKWDRDGNKLTHETWVDGERHGRVTTWHTNGHKREEGDYFRGKKDGPWIEWDGAGNVVAEVHYRKGQEVSRKTK
jgi:hypothetical protein